MLHQIARQKCEVMKMSHLRFCVGFVRLWTWILVILWNLLEIKRGLIEKWNLDLTSNL